jgi:dipeptidyl aminopeptidase/acylaminoacyl peptidase
MIRFKSLLKLVAVLPMISCAKPGISFVNALASIKGQKVEKGISFGELKRHLLDVYSPSESERSDSRPVVVFFYGSGWTEGTKDDFAFVAEAFTSAGYVVVVPDYGMHPEVIFPEFVEDGAKAVAWVVRNIQSYGGNPNKLFFLGHSAGAHLAALLNADANYLANQGVPRAAVLAVVGLAGPYDFVPEEEIFKQVFVNAGVGARAGMVTTYIDGNQAPMLALYGLKDKRVGLSNITKLQAGVSEKGGELRVKVYEHLGHVDIVSSVSIPLRRKATVLADVLGFFSEILERAR